MTRAARAARILYWLLPILFCIAIYWRGMRIWFAQDDFAWLNLRNHVTDFRSFLWALFAPLAQGTIRPFSERGFFMLFSWLFGLRALPYRLFVFLNQFLNIVLVMLVTRRLTRSDLAAFVAPLLWIANAGLVIPMAWTSCYNEVQCTTFLLLSFYFFMRYTEEGERKFYWAQWVTFILGFGALEIMVVYPAIAAAYALFFARRYLRSTVPLFAASAVYAMVHRLAGPRQENFYYEMSFHVRTLLSTLWQYSKILLGEPAFFISKHWPAWAGYAVVDLLVASILGFVAWQAWKRQFLPLFLLSWFLIVLAPLVPLHNHVTDYYLFVPAIGVAMLAAHALSLAWKRSWTQTAVVGALTLLYLVPATAVSYQNMIAYFDRADRVRAVVQSVAYAKRIHPGKAILLRGIDDDIFWSGIYDSPFRIFGWNDVFVTPDCRAQIHEEPHLGPVDPYILPESAVVQALRDQSAVVYSFEDRRLRNITGPYQLLLDSQPPPPLSARVDVGAPFFKDQLGEGWYSLEAGFRWSGKHAVVYLLGPATPGQKLTLYGFATEQQLKMGPLHFALTFDGRPAPPKIIDQGEFHLAYDLPPDLVGRPKIEVAFTLDRTFQVPSDGRDMGVVFGEFAIR